LERKENFIRNNGHGLAAPIDVRNFCKTSHSFQLFEVTVFVFLFFEFGDSSEHSTRQGDSLACQ
jgi:hypothetical protein